MPDFTYKAVRRDGSSAEGTVSALDRTDAARRLSSKGLQVFQLDTTATVPAGNGNGKRRAAGGKGPRSATDIAAATAPPPSKPKKLRRLTSPSPTPASKGKSGVRSRSAADTLFLRSKHIIQFTEELSDLLGAGVQLEPSLKMMEGRGDSSVVRTVAARVRENVRDGMSFSRALAQASPSFGELYCNLVSAGEASGALPAVLKRQVQYLTTLQDLRGRVLTAMIYPAFLVISGLAVTALFAAFLIPRLSMLIESTGGTPPPLARFIIASSEFLASYGWLVALIIIVAVAAIATAIKAPGNRYWWGRTQLRIPLLGPLQLSRFHVQFLETLGAMISNGLTLLKGLELASGSTRNPFLQEQIGTVATEVADGSALHRSLERRGVFPTGLVDMVRIGEQTGRLEDAVVRSAERYDRELNKRIERITALVQPLIILVLAVVVGAMAYLMINLIYETISIIRAR